MNTTIAFFTFHFSRTKQATCQNKQHANKACTQENKMQASENVLLFLGFLVLANAIGFGYVYHFMSPGKTRTTTMDILGGVLVVLIGSIVALWIFAKVKPSSVDKNTLRAEMTTQSVVSALLRPR